MFGQAWDQLGMVYVLVKNTRPLFYFIMCLKNAIYIVGYIDAFEYIESNRCGLIGTQAGNIAS